MSLNCLLAVQYISAGNRNMQLVIRCLEKAKFDTWPLGASNEVNGQKCFYPKRKFIALKDR